MILVLNTKKIDLSFMLYVCDSLREFKLITDEENKPEEELNKEEDSKNNPRKLIPIIFIIQVIK